jgi:uncharacterized protein DUF6308
VGAPSRPGVPLVVTLRNDTVIEDPVPVILRFLEAGWVYDVVDESAPRSFREDALRLANRGGARISAAQIEEILGRRRAIERALRAIAPDASLAAKSVPWKPMRQLFDAFADVKGVGLSKMTKALHPKRRALIPMLDSVVQRYLADADPGAEAPFGERALALTRGYKNDLDRNRRVLGALRRRYAVTEVRLLDLLIWSAAGPAD